MPLPQSRTRSPGRRLRLIAGAVAGLGLAAAAAVFFLASNEGAGDTKVRVIGGQAYANDDSSTADRQSERLGGKALVRTAEFDHWLRSLLEGRRLAATLAVLSLLVAGLCLWLAGLMDEADEHAE